MPPRPSPLTVTPMDQMLIWGFVLLAAALLLTVIEIFVPSAGLISMVAAAVAIAGIVCLWIYDSVWGVSGLLGSMILLPTVFFSGISIWTSTNAGRRAIGLPSEEELEARRARDVEARRLRDASIGKIGVVLTEMRPVGIIELEGKRVDALAEVGFISPGTKVRVVSVDANEMKVRPI